METLLPRRDSKPRTGSAPTGNLGTGMGVAAVWVISGGVKLLFRSTWPFTGTTSRECCGLGVDKTNRTSPELCQSDWSTKLQSLGPTSIHDLPLPLSCVPQFCAFTCMVSWLLLGWRGRAVKLEMGLSRSKRSERQGETTTAKAS